MPESSLINLLCTERSLSSFRPNLWCTETRDYWEGAAGQGGVCFGNRRGEVLWASLWGGHARSCGCSVHGGVRKVIFSAPEWTIAFREPWLISWASSVCPIGRSLKKTVKGQRPRGLCCAASVWDPDWLHVADTNAAHVRCSTKHPKAVQRSGQSLCGGAVHTDLEPEALLFSGRVLPPSLT